MLGGPGVLAQLRRHGTGGVRPVHPTAPAHTPPTRHGGWTDPPAISQSIWTQHTDVGRRILPQAAPALLSPTVQGPAPPPCAAPSITMPQGAGKQQHHRLQGGSKLPRHLDSVHHRVMADVRNRRLFSKGERLLLVVDGSEASVCMVKLMLDLSGAWQWQLLVTFCPDPSAAAAHMHHMHHMDAAEQPATASTLLLAPEHQRAAARMQRMAHAWGLQFVAGTDSPHQSAQQQQQLGTYYDSPAASQQTVQVHLQQGRSTRHSQLIPAHPDTQPPQTQQPVQHSLQRVAEAHGCSTVVVATTATDCAAHLLANMLHNDSTSSSGAGTQVTASWAFTLPANTAATAVHTSGPPATHVGIATAPQQDPPEQRLGGRQARGACRVVQPLLGLSGPQVAGFAARHELLAWAQDVVVAPVVLPQPLLVTHPLQGRQPPGEAWQANAFTQRITSLTKTASLSAYTNATVGMGHAVAQQLPAASPQQATRSSGTAATGRGVAVTSAEYVRGTVLPQLRQHFNPAADVVLARMALMLEECSQHWATLNPTTCQDHATHAQPHGGNPARPMPHSQPPAGAPARPMPHQSATAEDPVRHMSSHGQPPASMQEDHVQPGVEQDDYVARIRQRFLDHVVDQQLLPRGHKLLVAVSGGQDSLCLLRLLRDLAPSQGWQLVVGHCDHRWRTDSQANASHVQQLCGSWGLPFTSRVAPDPALIRSEASARDWRYAALAGMAAEAGCDAVVTGHTLSDLVETQVLNLVRGAGPEGMLALQPRRTLRGGGLGKTTPLKLELPWRVRNAPVARQSGFRSPTNYRTTWPLRSAPVAPGEDMCNTRPGAARPVRDNRVVHLQPLPRRVSLAWRRAAAPEPPPALQLIRPQLSLRREDTGRVCAELGLPVWLDSTNQDVDIARRNRLRLEVMPLMRCRFGEGVDTALLAAARRAGREARAVRQAAVRLLQRTSLLQLAQAPEAGVLLAGLQRSGSGDQRVAAVGSGCCVYRLALDRHQLSVQLPAIRRQAVQLFLQSVPGLTSHLSFDLVDQVLQLLTAPNRTRSSTLAHVGAARALRLTANSLSGSTGAVVGGLSDAGVLPRTCAVTAQVHQHQIILVFSW